MNGWDDNTREEQRRLHEEELNRQMTAADASSASAPSSIGEYKEYPSVPSQSYTTTPENKELKQDIDTLEQSETKKKRRAALAVGAIALLLMLIVGISSTQPLDRLNRYEVRVTPQHDGQLIITYYYEWQVLNSTREGPLDWVQFGMANTDYELLEYGGALSRTRSADKYHAAFYLDKSYYKGDVVTMWFTVRQASMLCINGENTALPFYDFTPGWFDSMKVKSYCFAWKDSDGIAGHNADRAQDGYLVWEGSFGKGDVRQMQVYYDAAWFNATAQQVQWQAYTGGSSGMSVSGEGFSFIFVIFIFALLIIIRILTPGGYRRGRGFIGHSGASGGSSCACACAGCACACACAGGGRAGCTTKDFYAQPYTEACRNAAGTRAPGKKTTRLGA